VCYIVNCSDLHTVHPTNLLVKYADDTYLIIPGTNSSLIPDELNNITQWVSANNFKLNLNKSYEMIVHHSSKKLTVGPQFLENITRTHELTVLGVTFNSSFSFSQHMQNLTAKAATSLYALKTLKAHGLQGRALWDITQATLVAQITYASPSWRGFIKAEETARLKAVLSKARRYGYLPTDFHSLEDLLDSSDESLFRSIQYNPQHVLHQLLPPPKHADTASPSLLYLQSSCAKSLINRKLFNDDIF